MAFPKRETFKNRIRRFKQNNSRGKTSKRCLLQAALIMGIIIEDLDIIMEGVMRKKPIFYMLIFLIISINSLFSLAININHVGYNLNAKKTFVVLNSIPLSDKSFTIKNESGNIVFIGTLDSIGILQYWDNNYYYIGDFSSFNRIGNYKIDVGETESYSFEINEDLILNSTSSLVISFFNSMRNTMLSDTAVGYYGDRVGTHNVYGGWDDASGDQGKYLSHLSWANYFNPQQTPLVVWALLWGYELNPTYYDDNGIKVKEEAAWGADFLLRMQDEAGYFYITVFDGWGYDPPREICAWVGSSGTKTDDYESAFREGGAMAIAALARAYNMGIEGDSTKEEYLQGAIRGYNHIKVNNLLYTDDGKENIIDDYTTTIALVELYKATGDSLYLNDLRYRVNRILFKQSSEGFFYSDDDLTRPFYHASDEGMIILALLYYLEVDDALRSEVEQAISKNIDWYKSITFEGGNAYYYSKMYYKNSSGNLVVRYFMPHVNETGYWWQGENARILSMASAFYYYMIKENIVDTLLENIANSSIDWVLGKNPLNMCMMAGVGYNNPPPYKGDYSRYYKGGISNGITSDQDTEIGYQFLDKDYYDKTDWHHWRWVEHWLPHDAWYFVAINLESFYIKTKLRENKVSDKKELKELFVNIYPNPFNPVLNIKVSQKEAKVYIYNIEGKLIKKFSGEGFYQVNFSDMNLSSGIYYIRAVFGNSIITKKAVLLK